MTDILEESLMRLPAVLAVIPVSKSTWWAGVKAGRFPQPVTILDRVTVWRRADILAYLQGISQSSE